MSPGLSSILRQQIVLNPHIKALAKQILASRRITGHPIYQKAYERCIDHQVTTLGKPSILRIENTAYCNAACLFCPHSRMKRKPGTMDEKLFSKLIREAKESGIDHVILHGFGEPLMDRGFGHRVVLAKSAGIRMVTTNTNGFLLTKETTHDLIDSGLDEVYVSFDAATAREYKKVRPGLDYQTIEHNLRRFVYIRNQRCLKTPKLYLSYVVCEENKNGLDVYMRRWRPLVDGISVSEMHNWGKGFSGAQQNGHQKDPCRMLWREMTVCWDGRIPICCNDYDATEVVGNVSQDHLLDIWTGERFMEIRRWHRMRDFASIPVCSHCTYNRHEKSPWWI